MCSSDLGDGISLDVAHRLAGQIFHRSENSTCDHFPFDSPEPDLDLIQPGGISRCEVQLDIGVLVQKLRERYVNRWFSPLTTGVKGGGYQPGFTWMEATSQTSLARAEVVASTLGTDHLVGTGIRACSRQPWLDLRSTDSMAASVCRRRFYNVCPRNSGRGIRCH